MNIIRGIGAAALLGAGLIAGSASAAVIDVIQAPTGFFVPSDALKFTEPYIRNGTEDWGWFHNPIAGPITSASLDISAYDVDYEYYFDVGLDRFEGGERDEIFAYDDGVAVSLGFLGGSNEEWGFTTFNLGSQFFDDIEEGLLVYIDIAKDTGEPGSDRGWRVSLAKSVLSVPAGGPRGNPDPVPEPASWAMLIAGFGLVGAMARRRRSVVAA